MMKIPYHRSNRIFIGVNLLLFCGYWGMVIYLFPKLPEQIPIHFGFDGTATRWTDTSASTWFFLPAVITATGLHAIFIGWVLLASGIESWNFPGKREILKLDKAGQAPFKKIIGSYVCNLLHGTAFYALVIFWMVSMYVYQYSLGGASFSLSLVLILISVLYLAYTIRQYFFLRKNLRKKLTAQSKMTAR